MPVTLAPGSSLAIIELRIAGPQPKSMMRGVSSRAWSASRRTKRTIGS